MALSIEVNDAQTSQTESATTLRTIVELVRRITHADVASVVSFSLVDKTITWRAVSGFRAHAIDDTQPLVHPITNELAQRAVNADSVLVLQASEWRTSCRFMDFLCTRLRGFVIWQWRL